VIASLTKGAEAGNWEAQLDLGDTLASSGSIKAEDWLAKSASYGHPKALYKYGRFLLHDRIIIRGLFTWNSRVYALPENARKEKGYLSLCQAAEKGSGEADLILARIFGKFSKIRLPLPDDGLSLWGDPFPVKNIPTARQHLERAAAQKIPEALFLLGHFHLSGGRAKTKMCHYMGSEPYPSDWCDKARPFFEAAVAGDRKLIPAGYLRIYKHFLDRCNGKW
jgi:TPR repeat protein